MRAEGWKFGNQTIKTIRRDDNRRLNKSVKSIGGTIHTHAVACSVNDRDGIIILFDEPVNGVQGVHLGGFHGFVKSRRSRDKLSEVLADLGFGTKDWIARELTKAYGDEIISFAIPEKFL